MTSAAAGARWTPFSFPLFSAGVFSPCLQKSIVAVPSWKSFIQRGLFLRVEHVGFPSETTMDSPENPDGCVWSIILSFPIISDPTFSIIAERTTDGRPDYSRMDVFLRSFLPFPMSDYAQEAIKPYGADQGSKRSQVETMFNRIAHSYDLLNHTLSLGIDRIWRRNAIRHLKALTAAQPPRRILDVATGTGDLAMQAYRELRPHHIDGVDISAEMMAVGREKVAKARLSEVIDFQLQDCSSMTFPSQTFDAVISAFALRNFQNLDECLAEMRRVMKPGSPLVAIDLCTPVAFPMRQLFWIYQRCVMPLIGRFISHDNHAYVYLPQTMAAIPQADDMTAIFRRAGFTHTAYRRLLFGMCIRYSAQA